MSSQLQAFGSWRIILLNSDDLGDDGDVLTRVGENAAAFRPGGGGGAAWGGITGTLSAQTDLQAALDAVTFDQDLNTTSAVVFASVETSAITMPGDSDPLFTVDPWVTAQMGDYVRSDRAAYYTSAPIFNTDIDLEPTKALYLTGLVETDQQNPAFTGNANGWTLAGGWAYADDAITHTPGVESDASQALTTTSGRTYNINITISGRTAGSLTVLFAGGDSKELSINGTFTRVRIGAGENDTFTLRASSDFDGTVESAYVNLLDETNIYGDTDGFNINAASGITLTFPGALNINGTPGVTAGPFTTITSITVTKGFITDLQGS